MESKDVQIVELEHPPKPPLAFRVGVVGHRPHRLPKDMTGIRGAVTSVLSVIDDEVRELARRGIPLYVPGEPILRMISPLAEGVDRLAAEVALGLQWDLACVLPFHRPEYEKDFAKEISLEPDSLARFVQLLDQSTGCFELDGSRADASSAYEAAGELVLNQSDLLIAVWDHERRGKHGGTETTMRQAIRLGIPVLCIDARSPHEWRWFPATGGSHEESIRTTIRSILELPELTNGPTTSESVRMKGDLKKFQLECRPRRNIAVLWRIFRSLLGDGTFPRLSVKVELYELDVLKEWPTEKPVPNKLRPFYAWPDKLADLYADRYRSSFLLSYLLAGLAVGLALAPIVSEMPVWAETMFGSGEFLAIAIVLGVISLGRKQSWHEKWIDYRFTSEQIRHLRLVAQVGGARPFLQLAAHHASYGHPSWTWMTAYVNAVARWIGLPMAVFDNAYALEMLEVLSSLIDEQMAFHERNAERAHKIERKLQAGTVGLLVLTLVVCVLHLGHVPIVGHFWTFCCGFFPAVGAALAGVNNQGEFRRVSKRSRSMAQQLAVMRSAHDELKALVDMAGSQSMAKSIRNLSEDVARLMVQEVLDWRVVFLDRPLLLES